MKLVSVWPDADPKRPKTTHRVNVACTVFTAFKNFQKLIAATSIYNGRLVATMHTGTSTTARARDRASVGICIVQGF